MPVLAMLIGEKRKRGRKTLPPFSYISRYFFAALFLPPAFSPDFPGLEVSFLGSGFFAIFVPPL
jgi:hypothetical protein